MTLNIENIWRKDIPHVRDEIVAFWEANKLLPPGADARDRAMQVVLIVREPAAGKICGITSADVVQFKQLNNNNFFLFRIVIHPDFRVPGLVDKMLIETRDFLEEFSKTDPGRCVGLLTVVENPGLIKHRNEAVWPATKMVYIGNDKQGRHIRVYYFKGSRI
ncbi:MAG TPA: hypothetical protein VFE50_02350 [Cyclobacteriaceae bacterium]|nr:hypothetical protein [Cyclobacteriaceae bacterium]